MSPHQQSPMQQQPSSSRQRVEQDVEQQNGSGGHQTESLLVQALEYHETPLQDAASSTTTFSVSSSPSSLVAPDPIIPVHSDFTIPTSNVSPYTPDSLLGPPPPNHHHHLNMNTGMNPLLHAVLNNNNNNPNRPPSRRNVFGGRVEQKYNVVATSTSTTNGEGPSTALWASTDAITGSSSIIQAQSLMGNSNNNNSNKTNGYNRGVSELTSISASDITPPSSPRPRTPKSKNRNIMSPPDDDDATDDETPIHETIHAQSLLLGLAFMAIWSPQNCMAPNLTQMANDFGFSEVERDFYLGANVAFATGVLSLPIAGGIGILADVWNRKYLFCTTVALGGISAYLTGASQTYRQLFFARLLNGAFMSGSTPVAFSLLGDLFDTNERNAASSGLTAMMGMGIIVGQVYAGVVGSTKGWSHAFNVSACMTLGSALFVLLLVREPVRGGKEEVLQDMLRRGTRYERKLTWKGFVATMRNNESNVILMWQGFFSSIPWGIIFVFLNDYLSQERGFSVPDATYLVAVFGIGCACGGVLGGYWGGIVQNLNRSYLPIFMAVTTFLGIFPFLGLLNGTFTNAHGYMAVGYSFLGGFTASLPSVCVRPCLINVNPPETRGAALTAANLVINLARGAGPSCITLLGAIFSINRQTSFNVTLSVFWTIAALQLFCLSKTLPKDQDAMDADLAQYAASALAANQHHLHDSHEDSSTLVSIEDRMTSWDDGAARESMQFVGAAFKEIGNEMRTIKPPTFKTLHLACPAEDRESDEEDASSEVQDRAYVERRRQVWIQQQQQMAYAANNNAVQDNDNKPLANETTRLL